MGKHPFRVASAVIICMLLLTPPLIKLFSAVNSHFGFLRDWTAYEKTKAPSTAIYRINAPQKTKSKFKFINFSVKIQAESVSLIGDFNNWQPKANEMLKKQGGNWEISIPLPSGRYRYLFLADDEFVIDEKNQNTAEFEGETVSFIEVGT